ncbi:MAG: hypothetical protein LBU66_07400 [Treponema sp.]|jgi:hypothetical protein|nr:hypothetical protein [Treponema sp.]
MKKFFFTLFILIVLGAVGFFFGWAQLEVPPGSYGVISSKTHGTDPRLIQSGEFRWIWYKLIPTNVQISVFKLDPVKYPIDFNSSLPSGNTYAAFSGLSSSDFSWNLRGEISLRINPDKLIDLVSQYNLTDQETLDAYLQEIAKSINVIILRTLSSDDIETQRLEKILSGNPDNELEREIMSRYAYIRDFSFVISSARFPDFVLYRQVRLVYEDFLSKQREFVTASLGRRAESHIEAQFHFGELERYGELLTKYPILLNYMALNREKELP